MPSASAPSSSSSSSSVHTFTLCLVTILVACQFFVSVWADETGDEIAARADESVWVTSWLSDWAFPREDAVLMSGADNGGFSPIRNLLEVPAGTSAMGQQCTDDKQLTECGLLVCRANRCSTCQADAECQRVFARFVCRNNACVHKQLFPMMWSDIATSVIAVTIVSLAAGGGIGGGGALVPIYVVVLGFTPPGAIPLSKATLFGGAISNFIINMRKRHPTADRPMIDFHTATLFVPTQLLGTMVGVLCNKVWPSWLITLCLVFFLSYLTVITAKAGQQIHERETGHTPALAEEQDGLLTQEPTTRQTMWHKPPSRVELETERPKADPFPLSINHPSSAGEDESIVGVMPREELARERKKRMVSSDKELMKLYENERTVPFKKLGLLACLWLIVFLFSLLRGGEGGSVAGVVCASGLYWALFAIPFPIFLGLVWLLARERRQTHEKKVRLGFEYQPHDVVWQYRNSLVYPLMNIGVGFGSGSLGIGGGAITGPLMLQIGMHPQVVSATAAFMILFTASTTSAQFLVLGVLEPTYAAWFACLGFLGSFIGQAGMSYLLQKYRKQSIVVFSIAGVLCLSGVLMGLQGIYNTVHDIEVGNPMGFRPLCGLV